MPQIVMTITVNVSDEDTNNGELLHHVDHVDMKQLVRDALSEFCWKRGFYATGFVGVTLYVEERYKDQAWPPSRYEAKVAEVFNRCWLASTLKKGDVLVEVKR